MPQSASSRRDAEGHCGQERTQADGERLRSVRERLDLIGFVLGELECLRQRQEVLVRSALEEGELQEVQGVRWEAHVNSEENLLVLRKQLSRLRRRDAGLIGQLHELDQQINDLRLDTDVSHEQLYMDSRPSSGFYELSDGASGSLSNSSHSVFSECFCSAADAEGHSPSTEELASCLESDVLTGGLCDELSFSGAACCSVPTPQQLPLDAVSLLGPSDFHSKYYCELLARNVNEIYCYSSPLHAVAIQRPDFLQTFSYGAHGKDQAGAEVLKTKTSPLPESVAAPLKPQSFFLQTHSNKHLDSYICSLLQRWVQPIRTSRPRTSFSTDPSKSLLRQASLCVKQVSGPSSGLETLRRSEIKPAFPAGVTSAEDVSTSPPPRQCSKEKKSEEQETKNVFPGITDVMQASFKVNSSAPGSPGSWNIQTSSSVTSRHSNTNSRSLIIKKGKGLLPHSAASITTLLKDFKNPGSPSAISPQKDTCQPFSPTEQELFPKSGAPAVKTQTGSTKNGPKLLQSGQTENVNRPVLELSTPGSSSKSLTGRGREGGRSHMPNGRHLPKKQLNVKCRKGSSKNIKNTKVKSTVMTKTMLSSECDELPLERRGDKSQKSNSKKSLLLEDGSSTHIHASNRGSSSRTTGKAPPKHASSAELKHHQHGIQPSPYGGHHPYHHHHHHHVCDQVVIVAKPKYKHNDYQRLHLITEMPYNRAMKRVQRRQRKLLLRNSVCPSSERQQSSPNPYTTGSDSEYSAECLSLFHSTIVDTSEDEKSNYTTNCFGDSESSEEDCEEENTTTTDTEESVVGGPGVGRMGRGKRQSGAAGLKGAYPAQTKTFVKIKASYNLKKKILRFRSGSLKLMTTV